MVVSLENSVTEFALRMASREDAPEIAVLVGDLLHEIMSVTGAAAFNFDLSQTVQRLQFFLDQEKYVVFLARSSSGKAVGFIALYESYALYAEGAFGTIPELYVHPDYRQNSIGTQLINAAKSFADAKGWTRLEVTTPPLPEFSRTFSFYQREGFVITGGRKLKTTW